MISIIIPTFNEAATIRGTLDALWKNDAQGLVEQILVSDGGSADGTPEAARACGATVINSPRKGRAAQMNAGAAEATGAVLYFLHADTLPPEGFANDIARAVQKGVGAGCFRLAFDYEHWFLKANCWFTRFDVDAVRFGDQSLFVTKKRFEDAGGFCEQHLVLEDQHLVKHLKKRGPFVVLNKPVQTSARKYLENGVYKTQGIFFLIYLLYRMGCSQPTLVSIYRRLIRQDKL